MPRLSLILRQSWRFLLAVIARFALLFLLFLLIVHTVGAVNVCLTPGLALWGERLPCLVESPVLGFISMCYSFLEEGLYLPENLPIALLTLTIACIWTVTKTRPLGNGKPQGED